MKTIKLKVEQNGGEYYGYVSISGVPNESKIIKSGRGLEIDNLKIKFDELIEILEIV
jgi:hypothetical protein